MRMPSRPRPNPVRTCPRQFTTDRQAYQTTRKSGPRTNAMRCRGLPVPYRTRIWPIVRILSLAAAAWAVEFPRESHENNMNQTDTAILRITRKFGEVAVILSASLPIISTALLAVLWGALPSALWGPLLAVILSPSLLVIASEARNLGPKTKISLTRHLTSFEPRSFEMTRAALSQLSQRSSAELAHLMIQNSFRSKYGESHISTPIRMRSKLCQTES